MPEKKIPVEANYASHEECTCSVQCSNLPHHDDAVLTFSNYPLKRESQPLGVTTPLGDARPPQLRRG